MSDHAPAKPIIPDCLALVIGDCQFRGEIVHVINRAPADKPIRSLVEGRTIYGSDFWIIDKSTGLKNKYFVLRERALLRIDDDENLLAFIAEINRDSREVLKKMKAQKGKALAIKSRGP